MCKYGAGAYFNDAYFVGLLVVSCSKQLAVGSSGNNNNNNNSNTRSNN